MARSIRGKRYLLPVTQPLPVLQNPPQGVQTPLYRFPAGELSCPLPAGLSPSRPFLFHGLVGEWGEGRGDLGEAATVQPYKSEIRMSKNIPGTLTHWIKKLR